MRRAIRPGGLWAAVVLALTLGSAHWQAVQAAPAADPIIHTVQPGETLYLIGLQYGVGWTDIMQANQLSNTTIYAGQPLVIPAGGAAPTSAPPDQAATPAPPALPDNSTTYVVQRGDNLAAIARQYDVALSDIVAANNLSNPSLIFAGQVLSIPTGPTTNTVADNTGSIPPPGKLPGDQKLILVSISQQRMSVYQDGRVMWQWVVSTGEPGLDTWPGQYGVLDKIPNAYGANWDLWMPNWLGIYWAGRLENGIHALPILPNGLRLWDGYLGRPVSFGCVILGVQEAQTLYDWADVGTPVNIQE
jgi:LysM repeat protein